MNNIGLFCHIAYIKKIVKITEMEEKLRIKVTQCMTYCWVRDIMYVVIYNRLDNNVDRYPQYIIYMLGLGNIQKKKKRK